ncbi:centrosomal protein [Cricetulus griseus]|uniref:Centrosomal protein of 70 kDa n=1 Tax=Cricetulus griseus TaxID=10029 RepID=A0A061I8R8_CRIGR|nr:centrosomal protein [Cricetulus griseus]
MGLPPRGEAIDCFGSIGQPGRANGRGGGAQAEGRARCKLQAAAVEGTQIFLLPISTLESTKETMPPAAPKAQDTHQLSDKLLIEKQLKVLLIKGHNDIRELTVSFMDSRLLCLIDYYESKLRKLHTQRQSKEDDSQSEEETNHRNLDASPSYKGLLMSLQNQLKEAKFKIDVLLGEKLNLQKDLESRLQALTGQKKTDYTEKKDEPSKDSHQQVLVDQRYFQVLCSINSIIHNPRTPVIIYKQRKGGAQNLNKDTVQDCGFEHLIPIIETWADELTSLKDLYKSLKILSAALVPWHNLKKPDENDGVKVEDLLCMVDTMLEEVENKKESSNMLNFQTLQAIVSHFQKLFDVHSLNGVYPRMNEVYTRLGEMNNAVRNLQELLELDSSSSLCVVVSTVGKLCKIINEDVNDQVKQVLGPEDLQSIINKLEEHEEFFPAFQAFTSDLLEILEIDDLDAIVPAVKKLKVLSY